MIIVDTRKRFVTPRPSSILPPTWSGPDVPRGWLPAGIGRGDPSVRWIGLGDAPLVEPFFSETLLRLRTTSPPAYEWETGLAALESGLERLSPVSPSGIIVHMTRCGSTLLARALRNAVGAIVPCEAQAFATAMLWASSPSRYWSTVGARLLGTLTTTFAHYQGRPVPGQVVIKCGTEGLFLLRTIHAVWPGIPCLIMVRNPIEVLVSISRNIPKAFLSWYDASTNSCFGVPPREVLGGEPLEYWAWIMGRFCSDAQVAVSDKCRVLDYSDITPKIAMKVGEYFGLSFPEESPALIRDTFRVNAKSPSRVYAADSASKTLSASEVIKASSARWADGPYASLRERAARWDGAEV